MFNIENLSCERLDQNTSIKSFDCGDNDLNDFLANDAINYLNERMAVTHLLMHDKDRNEFAAYFCLLNDKLVFDLSAKEKKKLWIKFF